MRLDRSLEVFERLGGGEVREIARAFFENPGRDTMAPYVEKCFPLYHHAPMNPHLIPRTIMNSKLTEAFFRADIKQFNLLPELSKLRRQTLVIGGDDDPITPVADQEDIVAAIPKDIVRFERFAHAGHGVVDDEPAALFKLVREFISA
jgi:proline iminopeptidase